MPKSKVSNLGAVLTLYFAYGVYAMGLIVSSQLSEQLGAQWGVTKEVATSAIAWMAIGKVVSYTFAGAISDKLGRKLTVLVGIILNALFFFLLPLTPNATLGIIVALIFGIGNSFLDAGAYPTFMESAPQNASTMNILVKIFISAGQFVMPFMVTAAGTNWKLVPYLAGVYMAVMAVLTLLMKYPDYKAIAAGQLEKMKQTQGNSTTQQSARARFGFEGVLCLIFVFCGNGTVYLANQALPQIGNAVAHLDSAQSRTLTQALTIGSLAAVIVTALGSTKIKSVFFIPVYGCLGAVAILGLNLPFLQNLVGMRITAFFIGFFVSGGILQLVLTAMSDFFPKAKGQIVSWYWMVGALGGFILPWVIRFIVADTNGMADGAAKDALLASGYTNVVWLAVAFAVVSAAMTILIFSRHRTLFAKPA